MKMIDNWKAHLKSYSAISLFGTVLVSAAYGASLALGIGVATISPLYIILSMGLIGVFGAVGRFIQQTEKTPEELKDD